MYQAIKKPLTNLDKCQQSMRDKVADVAPEITVIKALRLPVLSQLSQTPLQQAVSRIRPEKGTAAHLAASTNSVLVCI
jgi:hypothetical protein